MLSETRATIERLRGDHDFFMHQLAPSSRRDAHALNYFGAVGHRRRIVSVRDTISVIEQKLAAHH